MQQDQASRVQETTECQAFDIARSPHAQELHPDSMTEKRCAAAGHAQIDVACILRHVCTYIRATLYVTVYSVHTHRKHYMYASESLSGTHE